MDEINKILENNSRYLDIAKKITYSLHNICIESKEEYSGIEIIIGLSLGIYTFIKSISDVTGVDVKTLYEEINKWTNVIFDKFSDNEIQAQKSVSRSEDQVVGEIT